MRMAKILPKNSIKTKPCHMLAKCRGYEEANLFAVLVFKLIFAYREAARES